MKKKYVGVQMLIHQTARLSEAEVQRSIKILLDFFQKSSSLNLILLF